ncbi:MAG: M20/M25/M40 family metallo-hydrolase [Sphingomonadales bacterium]
MKHLILFAAALPALALAAPDPATMRDAALTDNVAWDIVEGLTTEVGQRMAGTEAEARARAWAVVKLKALGFKNVRIETYDMPTWVRGIETAEIVSPFPQKLVLTALGNSGATPEGGLTAQVVYFETIDALKAARPEDVRGKIAFVDHRMMRAQDGSGYGPFGAARRQGPSIASKLGAAAIVVRSIGTDSSRAPHTGVQSWSDGATPIPAAALSIADSENLERMLTRKKPVMMKLILTPRQTGMQQSGNVIAEVPGTDPSAGIVLIGGHLDSWDLGTGAIDDASGVAITTAAAKRILDSGEKPRRTIRVVWFGAEEVGTFGAIAYEKAHGSEYHALAAESDFGADRVWRFDVSLPDAAKPLTERLRLALAPLGIQGSNIAAAGGADVAPIIKGGASAVELNQDGTRYFDLHHTPEDTLDKVDKAQLQQNVAAWTAMLAIVAHAPETLGKPKS